MDYTKLELLKKACLGAVAKTDRENSELYLPLWMHLADTAGVMEFLAKSWISQSLRDYLIPYFGSEEDFYEVCSFLGISHDFGKATAVFQSRILSCFPGKDFFELPVPKMESFTDPFGLPHSLASEVLLESFGVSESLSSITGAHHGKSQGYISDDPDEIIVDCSMNFCGLLDSKKKTDIYDRWKKLWAEIFQSIKQICLTDDDLISLKIPAHIDFLLTGLLVMADWIASNPYYFPLIDVDESVTTENYSQRIQKGINKLKLPAAWQSFTYSMDNEEFNGEFGFNPNEIQKEIIDIANTNSQLGLLILEAQMGVGKTEAALACSEIIAGQRQMGGLFFGLPTQATANGLFPRITSWAKHQAENNQDYLSIQLAHGKAFLNSEYQQLLDGKANFEEEDSGLIVHRWMRGRKQSMLSDFVVGTVDQVLMAALNTKHVMLRHIGLASKVVIIDEVHSYDPYMNTYLDRALEWLGRYDVPVILLSATLPGQRRNSLLTAYLKGKGLKPSEIGKKLPPSDTLSYPLISWTENQNVFQKEVPILINNHSIMIEKVDMENEVSQIVTEIKQNLSTEGCAGIIVNTVTRAQNLAEALEEELEDYTILLFHSRFTSKDRAKKEEEVLKKVGKESTPEQRNKTIIIGTQVLEQSLDIDFDIMWTDLAPMDLLLQRIGRLHRHKGRQRPCDLKTPKCFIVDEPEDFEGGAKAIYGSWILQQTRDCLKEEIIIPKEISSLVQQVYACPNEDELDINMQAFYQDYLQKKKEKEGRAKGYVLNEPGDYDENDTSENNYSMDCMMTNSLFDTKEGTQATVRDTGNSYQIILIKEENHCIRGIEENTAILNLRSYNTPTDPEAKQLLLSQIAFPCGDKIIDELEKRATEFVSWQQNNLLKGEFFLPFDSNNRCEICGNIYEYSSKFGLIRKEKK
jgi:CRISPR-associated endonuclease/helicase Cas3